VEANRDEWIKGAAQVNVTWSPAKAARLGAYADVLGAAAVFPDDRSDDGGDVSFTPTSWRACACCRKHEPSVSDDTDLCTRCAAVQGTVSEALS